MAFFLRSSTIAAHRPATSYEPKAQRMRNAAVLARHGARGDPGPGTAAAGDFGKVQKTIEVRSSMHPRGLHANAVGTHAPHICNAAATSSYGAREIQGY